MSVIEDKIDHILKMHARRGLPAEKIITSLAEIRAEPAWDEMKSLKRGATLAASGIELKDEYDAKWADLPTDCKQELSKHYLQWGLAAEASKTAAAAPVEEAPITA